MPGDADLVRGRECGTCAVCCIMPTIDRKDIQKLPGMRCRHSLQGGCNIYETRPDVCRTFYCGWRRSREFPEDWRPDTSGVFAALEVNELPQYQPLAIILNLVGNPLKIVRRPDFIDLVIRNVSNNVAVYLALPGPPGKQTARVSLNNPPLMEAAGRSRAEVKTVLEALLKKLAAHNFVPYVMDNSGNDVTT
jgi:hypothetical protein